MTEKETIALAAMTGNAIREALEPFAKAARAFEIAIGPDGIDDGLTVEARISARPEHEVVLSTADFSRARAILSTHTAAGAGPRDEATSGLQQAINFIEKRRDDFMREVGVYDHTTGAVDMSDAAHETVGEWDELIDAFRAMIAAAPSTSQIGNAGAGPGRCSSCDGTGDLIRMDGEWLGWCPCGAAGKAGAGPVGEAVERDEGWHPIETAPTGGKFGCFLMLAFGPPGDQTVSEGMHFQGRFYAASVFYTGGPHDTKQFTFREHEVKPTHWRHILAAPGAARPVEEPGEVERLTRELAEANSEVDRLTDENSDLRSEPWPEWASAVLKVIRERSGYDGYDDTSEGVDLPAELDECMDELESAEAHQRTRAETAEAALSETRERLEKVEAAARIVVSTEADFRQRMPEGWEGDPLTDAVATLADLAGDAQEAGRSPDVSMWGRWFPHDEAPGGSYACLYRNGERPVSLAWMPAQGRPTMPDTVVMPFRMPGDAQEAGR